MNPSDEQDRERRIRERAYRLWEEEGRPEGRADVHWDKATELVAIEENYRLTMHPPPSADSIGPTGEPIEPIEAVENLGEFPTMTDQGEERSYPLRQTRDFSDAGTDAPAAAEAAPAPITSDAARAAKERKRSPAQQNPGGARKTPSSKKPTSRG